MNKLIRIIRAFDKYKMPHIDVLNNKDSTSQHTQLYRAILDGKVSTDDDAAKFLFSPAAKKGDQKYRNFKTEFKKRLLNTMLFIDPSHEDFDKYQQVFYEIHREWMTIKAIYASNMSDLTNPLAEQLLNIVMKHDYTEIVLPLIGNIKFGIAMTGNKKRYAEYQQLHNHYIELWLWEIKAKEYADILRMEYVKSAEHKPFMSDTAKGYFEELKPAMEKYDAVGLHTYGRVVEIYIYSTVSDYENVLDVVERALAFFRSKSFEISGVISLFQHQKMIALMMLKRYTESEKMIEETLSSRVKGSFNWFTAQESRAFLLFKMHRFTEGYALYTSITTMAEFKALPEGMVKEMWVLFNAYFHVLQHLGKMPLSTFEEKDKVFKIPKFLNNVSTFCKDKKGMNIVILSVEMSFLVATKQYTDLIKRLESIEKYFDRYAKKDDPYYRFHQFGSLLLEIPKSNFNRILTKKNTVELLENLQSVAFDPVTSVYRGEVMNVEEIWDWLLETLKE